MKSYSQVTEFISISCVILENPLVVRSTSLLMNFQRTCSALIFSFLQRKILGGPIDKIVSSPDDDGFARLEDIFENC